MATSTETSRTTHLLALMKQGDGAFNGRDFAVLNLICHPGWSSLREARPGAVAARPSFRLRNQEAPAWQQNNPLNRRKDDHADFRRIRLMMTRRDLRRQQTIDDIKDTARHQLANGGPAGISLRAIARHLAMTAPAVHYYFPSRQALLDALIVDGFTSLAGALRAACEGPGPRLPGGQWLALCRAHRAWALDHQGEYLLLYGHPDTDAAMRRNPQVGQASSGVVHVLLSAIGEIVAAGQIDTERIEAATPPSLRRQLACWRDENGIGGGFPVGALAAYMIACTQLYGAITSEVLGHLPPAFADHGALFDLEMAHAFAGVGRPLSPEGIGGPRPGPWAAGQPAG